MVALAVALRGRDGTIDWHSETGSQNLTQCRVRTVLTIMGKAMAIGNNPSFLLADGKLSVMPG